MERLHSVYGAILFYPITLYLSVLTSKLNLRFQTYPELECYKDWCGQSAGLDTTFPGEEIAIPASQAASDQPDAHQVSGIALNLLCVYCGLGRHVGTK